jgi:PHD/YefM family antitoxin component YafN of YafNO toxin-antitoxin module
MLAINYSNVRNKLKYYCDRVTDDGETVLVTRKDDKNVVLLSLDQYNALLKAAGKPSPDMSIRGKGAAYEPVMAEKAKVSVDYKGTKQLAKDYANDVRKALPVDKVILFGSYAKGTATEASDINICFFLNDFGNKCRTDIIGELLRLCRAYKDAFFEPVAFKTAEIEQDNPFVREILATGIEV